MLRTFFQAAPARPRKRLEEIRATDHKKFVDPWKARVGHQLARARELAGLSQKELAGKFGHSDSAQLSRWESGQETPQLAAYFGVKDDTGHAFMQQPVVIALAALAEGGVEVHTTISIRKAVNA